MSWPGVILVAGSTIYSWYTASPQVSPVGPVARPAPVNAAPAERGSQSDAASIAALQLHDWRTKAPPHARPDRDIFAFTRPPAGMPVAQPALGVGLLAAPADGQSGLALFKLIGVAEDAGPEGISRTAIISGQGQLYMVKEGETVAWIYRVGRMSGESVELLDTTGGAPLMLFLK